MTYHTAHYYEPGKMSFPLYTFPAESDKLNSLFGRTELQQNYTWIGNSPIIDSKCKIIPRLINFLKISIFRLILYESFLMTTLADELLFFIVLICSLSFFFLSIFVLCLLFLSRSSIEFHTPKHEYVNFSP
jgi:hypothetical protein